MSDGSDRRPAGAVDGTLGTGAGAVLAVQAEIGAEVGRVLCVVVCRACRWQYGSWWLKSTVNEYWGDCPRCGGKTEVGSAFLPEHRSVPGVPAQQEIGL